MTTALHINANCCSVPKVSTSSHPPINFFYSHFHNSIRNELDALSQSVSVLTSAAQEDVHESLSALKNRYRFLEQVYKYHSSVEDEVCTSTALMGIFHSWPHGFDKAVVPCCSFCTRSLVLSIACKDFGILLAGGIPRS